MNPRLHNRTALFLKEFIEFRAGTLGGTTFRARGSSAVIQVLGEILDVVVCLDRFQMSFALGSRSKLNKALSLFVPAGYVYGTLLLSEFYGLLILRFIFFGLLIPRISILVMMPVLNYCWVGELFVADFDDIVECAHAIYARVIEWVSS